MLEDHSQPPVGITKLAALLSDNPGGALKIWDDPLEGREYVIGVDYAEGKVRDIGAQRLRPGSVAGMQKRDYSCGVVLDMETAQHVATLHGHFDPVEFTMMVAALGLYYNQALLVPEANNMGLAGIEALVKFIEYPNLYQQKIRNKVDPTDPETGKWGWKTDEQTRPFLIFRISELLANGSLLTRDQELIDELRTMEIDEQGRSRARGKNKDDRVLALGMALQGRYEMMHSTLGEVYSKPSTNRPEDAMFWRLIREKHDRHNTGGDFGGGARWGPREPLLGRD